MRSRLAFTFLTLQAVSCLPAGEERFLGPAAGEERFLGPAAGEQRSLGPAAGEQRSLGPAAGEERFLGPAAGEERFLGPAAGEERSLGPAATGLLVGAGEIAATGVEVAADVTNAVFTSKNDLANGITDATLVFNQRVEDLMDLKINFFLCNVFGVCPATPATPADRGRSDLPVGRSGLDSAMDLEDINQQIMDEATDEVIEADKFFLMSEGQRDFMKERIEERLCDFGYDQFCGLPARRKRSIDPSGATLTKSLVIRKIFTGFGVKMGYVLCSLRMWCPDEDLAFV